MNNLERASNLTGGSKHVFRKPLSRKEIMILFLEALAYMAIVSCIAISQMKADDQNGIRSANNPAPISLNEENPSIRSSARR